MMEGNGGSLREDWAVQGTAMHVWEKSNKERNMVESRGLGSTRQTRQGMQGKPCEGRGRAGEGRGRPAAGNVMGEAKTRNM